MIDEPYFRRKWCGFLSSVQLVEPYIVVFLLSVQLVEDVREVVCPLNFEPRNFKVYCCCHGLLAIVVHKNTIERCIFFMKSLNRSSNVLPAPNFQVGEFCCLGLSSDSTCGDYKILKIAENDHKAPGEILSLKSGS